MKKFNLFLLIVLLALASLAQPPQAFNYQAVVRHEGGAIISGQWVKLRISITQGSGNGAAVYTETHHAETNQFGLVNLAIGRGVQVAGNFYEITWGESAHFLKIELDPQGGNNFIEMGSAELLSVPYALFARSAGEGAVLYAAGSGISITEDESGNFIISNTAPDQLVTITGGGGTAVSGTYPDFIVSSSGEGVAYSAGSGIDISLENVISNTAPGIEYSAGAGLSLTGTTFSNTAPGINYTGGTGIAVSGSTITNTAPNQVVSLTGTGATSVTGAYPNFTITSTDLNTTYAAGTGITISGANNTITNTSPGIAYTGGTGISVSGSTITNTAPGIAYTAGTGISLANNTFTNTVPDRVVSLTGTGATSISGTYPNFTINSANTTYTAGTGITISGANNTITNTAPGIAYTAGTGISLANNIFTNTAPDQVVTLSSHPFSSSSITGTYPNFTIRTPRVTAGTGIGVSTNISGDYVISNTSQADGGVTVTVENLTPPAGYNSYVRRIVTFGPVATGTFRIRTEILQITGYQIDIKNHFEVYVGSHTIGGPQNTWMSTTQAISPANAGMFYMIFGGM
jgi:hypothetical protein